MNVILVFFDTMRADHASFNGYAKPATPNLDLVAAEGARFTQCYCTDVPTQPCYTATLSGQRGVTTGVVSHGQFDESHLDRMPWFPEVLARRGILTAAVSTLYRFRPWFARGFTHYLQPDMATWLQHVTADQVNAMAIPWLRAYGRKDFFLFLHYWDPHTPYNQVPKEFLDLFYRGDPYDPANRSLDDLRAREVMHFFISGGAVPELTRGLTDVDYPIAQYDGEIRYADDRFGRVLATLRDMKILDDTLLIFTSDHGEALGGEHGIYYDHMDAYEQVAHVPLLIRHPGRIEPRVIDAMVQHIDFAPTILEAFGMDVPPVFQGRSLWPLLEGKATDHYDAVFTNQGLWSAQRAMRTRDWTLMKTISRGMVLEAAPVELYRRSADPEEAHDLAAQHPDVLAALEERYHRWLESQLEDRPDPLRVTAQGPTAWKTVEARYRQHVESARRQAMTPADRAAIDHRPGDRRPRGSRT